MSSSLFSSSLVLLSVLAFVFVPTALASRPPPEGINKAYIQLQYNQISKVDGVEQAFSCDFYMTTTWAAPKANVNDSTAGLISSDLTADILESNYWNPQLEFVNDRGDGAAKKVDQPYSFVERPEWVPATHVTPEDYVWIKSDQRYTGDFTTRLDMHAFPFDLQDAVLNVESFYDATQLEIVFAQPEQIQAAVPSYMPDIVGWDRIDNFFHYTTSYYAYNQATYHRLVIGVHVRRQPEYFLAKIVTGVLLLVFMCIWVFSLAVDEADRMMGSLQVFGGLITFLFVLAGDVPKVPYLTRLDSFMMLSFFIVAACTFIHGSLYYWREDALEDEEDEAPKKRGDVEMQAVSTEQVGVKVADAQTAETGSVWRVGKPDGRPPFSFSGWWEGLLFTRKFDAVFVILLALTYGAATSGILGRPHSAS